MFKDASSYKAACLRIYQTVHFHNSTWFIFTSVLEEITQGLRWSLVRHLTCLPFLSNENRKLHRNIGKKSGRAQGKNHSPECRGDLQWGECWEIQSRTFNYPRLQESHSPGTPPLQPCPPLPHTHRVSSLVSLFLCAFREFSSQDST